MENNARSLQLRHHRNRCVGDHEHRDNNRSCQLRTELLIAIVVKASRGSEQYQATNSSIACWYPRLESGEPRLRRTAAFECSRSGIPSLVFGRLFLHVALLVNVFLMIAALQCGGS